MSLACTFMGHRDAPASVCSALAAALKNLVEKEGVTTFYVGNEGRFDKMAQRMLLNLQHDYPFVRCFIVLAYHPGERASECEVSLETIYPEGMERIPLRFAVSARNRWLLRHAAFAVTYIRRSWGGAAKFAEMAARQNVKILSL